RPNRIGLDLAACIRHPEGRFLRSDNLGKPFPADSSTRTARVVQPNHAAIDGREISKQQSCRGCRVGSRVARLGLLPIYALTRPASTSFSPRPRSFFFRQPATRQTPI